MTEPAPEVTVRPARTEDADLLLAWANDPVTRAASFSSAVIDRPDHLRWLAERLASPRTRLYIGELDGVPVGQVRFDLGPDGTAGGGISVAPAMRGRGLGRALLRAGVTAIWADPAFAGVTLVARVRVDNARSLRLFEGVGFRRRSTGTCDGAPCVTLELAP